MRRYECLATRRCAAVDGDLNQHFLDFIDGCTAGERRICVNAKLLKAPEPAENSKRQKTSRFLIKAGATPSIAPSQFGDGLLKCHHEFVRAGEICINILLAEYLFPFLETFPKQIAFTHCLPPLSDR